MQKSPLLNLILFFCLIVLIGGLEVSAVAPGCMQIGGRTVKQQVSETLDFTRISFLNSNPSLTQYWACIKPVGTGEYVSDGWAWNSNLGWVSLGARRDPENPSNRINSGVVVNSAYDYGVNIKKTFVNGLPSAKLTGYMWGDNVGWIKMNCEKDPEFAYDTDHCGAQQYGVSVNFNKPVEGVADYYYLQGYAWNPHFGYISFDEVAVGLPDVNFDFTPVVEYLPSDTPDYANGEPTNQGLVVRMLNDKKQNVSPYFNSSGLAFCLIFDDQRTFDGATRFSTELDLDSSDCTNHLDDGLNIFDSQTAFIYSEEQKGFVLADGVAFESFLSTDGGDLLLSYVKMYATDSDLLEFYPVSNVAINFDPPYEIYLVKGEHDDFESARENYNEIIDVNYGNLEDYTLAYKFYRGLLPEDNLFAHSINLGLSDNDLLDLVAEVELLNDEEPANLEFQNQVVDPSFRPAFELGESYDVDNEGVFAMKFNISKFVSQVPDEILATKLFAKVKYPFSVGGNNYVSDLQASVLRTEDFDTFEAFLKGFVQDRAFNSAYNDKVADTITSYARFKTLINKELSYQNIVDCSYSELSTSGCVVSSDLIRIVRKNNDPEVVSLADIYRFLGVSVSGDDSKTIILQGFNLRIDDDFSSQKPFGVVVLRDSSFGGRVFVDLDVTDIANLFLYSDLNIMSVDPGLEISNVNLDWLRGVGTPDVSNSKSFNQLVFSGQIISNNCSGCSRNGQSADGQNRVPRFADGRVVANLNKDLVLAQQEDINYLRYSPLIFNVERRNGALYKLNCDDSGTNTVVGRQFFSNGFDLSNMCFMPDRLGFDIKRSSLAETNNFPLNKQRSFMLFYADPMDLPIFSRSGL